MTKDVLITGISVAQQRKKAEEILKSKVLPKEQRYRRRAKRGSSSSAYIHAVTSNA